MDIEKLATSAFINLISRTDYLQPFVSEGDREPHWDGMVHVYSTKCQLAKDTLGRVPVQIKGQTRSSFPTDRTTFSVRTNDLKSYLGEGGALFVVCYLNQTGDHKLYYNALLPYDLKLLLKAANKHATKSIPLTPLPIDPVELSRIFFDFLSNRKKQYSVIEADVPLTIEDIKKEFIGQKLHFSFQYTQFKDEPPRMSLPPTPGAVLPTSGYMYATLPTGLTIPVAHTSELKVSSRNAFIPDKIMCNGRVYYSGCRSELTVDKLTLFAGAAITFTLDLKDQLFTFHLGLGGTLSQRIHDLSFTVAAMGAQEFYIGDFPVSLNGASSLEGLRLEDARQTLVQLQELQATLEKIDVVDDIDLASLTEGDQDALRMLVSAILYEEPISLTLINGFSPASYFRIGPLSILLGISKTEKSGYYRIMPIYKMQCKLSLKNDLKTAQPVSPYILFDLDSLRATSNLNFQRMTVSIRSFLYFEPYADRVQQLLLNLLSLYDETQKQDILFATDSLSSWLLENAPDDYTRTLSLLNRYQSLYRQRPLEQTEITELLSITENNSYPEQILIGVYILLGMGSAAKIHLSHLSPEEQTSFTSFPIYHLMPQE